VGHRRPVHAPTHRQLSAVVASALVLTVPPSLPVGAAPKSSQARVDFDRGVKAYKAADYRAAAQAFKESYGVEPDAETLFAWAQADRQLGRCAEAINHYDQLLARSLPDANRSAVEQARAECADILSKQQGSDVTDDDPDDGSDRPSVITSHTPPEHHVWYQDPIGDVIAGLGLVGLVVGAGFAVASNSAYSSAFHAPTEMDFYNDIAAGSDDHTHAVQFAIAGSVLVAAGAGWYLLHRSADPPRKRHVVTGWLDRSGGGLTFFTAW
jgi:hypothetical protein